MNVSLIGLMVWLGVISASFSDELKPGKAFPSIRLPSIKGGDLTAVGSFSGKKTMLHLFASW